MKDHLNPNFLLFIVYAYLHLLCRYIDIMFIIKYMRSWWFIFNTFSYVFFFLFILKDVVVGNENHVIWIFYVKKNNISFCVPMEVVSTGFSCIL